MLRRHDAMRAKSASTVEAEGRNLTAARAIRRASCWISTIRFLTFTHTRAKTSSGRRGNTSAFPPDFWTKAACRRASPPARGPSRRLRAGHGSGA